MSCLGPPSALLEAKLIIESSCGNEDNKKLWQVKTYCTLTRAVAGGLSFLC